MINILFGGNHNIAKGIKLCLMSMVKHTSEELNIYILSANVPELNENYTQILESDRIEFEKIVKAKNIFSKVQLIVLGKDFNDWILNSQNALNSYTPYAFLRLFINDIDKDGKHFLPNKILYLDTDIMINGDISELYNIDISNYELGVVKDRYGKFFINRKYFNSGMLLINLDKIRETKLFERVKDFCATKKMLFPDQTALNKLCKSKLYLPRRFNEQGNLRSDTVVQHFSKRIVWFPFHTRNIKPWDIESVHKIYKNHNYDDIYEEFLKNEKKE